MLQAVVTMLPPSSPTSKSPFFNMQAVGGAAGVGVTPGSDPAGGATNSTAAPAVAEVYNNVDLAGAFMGKFFSKAKKVDEIYKASHIMWEMFVKFL